jgi:hypothetical protein
MQKIEYMYQENNLVHVIQAKPSQTSKLGFGYAIQTYHWSIDQVQSLDIKQDKKNCFDCPLSYSNGGGCYTHNGQIGAGLKAMLKRLHRLHNENKIKPYDDKLFNAFIGFVEATYPVDLTRLGAYGEAVTLRKNIVEELVRLGKKHTAYTHQWKKGNYQDYFMASVHNETQRLASKTLGYRAFLSINKGEKVENSANCPASKEAGKKSTCVLCGLCNGNKSGNKKDVYILKHK